MAGMNGAAAQVAEFAKSQASKPFTSMAPAKPPKPPVNKSKSLNPSVNNSLNINITKSGGAPSEKAGSGSAPGSDFMSNEDIRAYCEHRRKTLRQLAIEVVLDAEVLEARLANIPNAYGVMSGSRARARRVVKPMKRGAQALKVAAKAFSGCYSLFEGEFESELMKIGRARSQQQPSRFRWR